MLYSTFGATKMYCKNVDVNFTIYPQAKDVNTLKFLGKFWRKFKKFCKKYLGLKKNFF